MGPFLATNRRKIGDHRHFLAPTESEPTYRGLHII
jgi:hypothetical protein